MRVEMEGGKDEGGNGGSKGGGKMRAKMEGVRGEER